MIVACVGLLIFVNELTHGNTITSLQTDRALTDARIAAAGVLQHLTDAETGQRGYLLTGRREYLEPLDAARVEVPRMQRTVAGFLESSGADGHAKAERMAQDIRDALAEIEKTIEMERAGDHTAALRIVDAGLGRRRMEDMRGIFAESLESAALRQQDAQTSIERNLWISRIAVTTLVVLGAIGLSFYVRHLRLYDQTRADLQHDLEAQVRRRTVELSELAGYLVTAREDEKAHLARELHDELGALMTAAKLDVARMRRKLSADPAMLERIDQISQRLNDGIALKRRIVEDLRPSALDTLGLAVSLANLCSEAASRLGVEILTAFEDVELTADGQLAIYRLVQEALTNVSKYARASTVRVSVVGEAGAVRVRIVDDGIGFDAAQANTATHGIAGMRFRFERLGGRMHVESTPGTGTRLEAYLPASDEAPVERVAARPAAPEAASVLHPT